MSLPRADAATVVERAGDAWPRIADALPTDWLDEETYNALTEGARAELGDERFRALFRALGRKLHRNPSFQSAIEAVIRISGLSPHAMLRFAPRGRAAIVYDSGELTYEHVSNRCAALQLRGFPASTYRTGTTLLLLSGTWLGILDLTGAGATAELSLEAVDLEQGHTRFVLRW